jgi:HK97 family phage prohead protease
MKNDFTMLFKDNPPPYNVMGVALEVKADDISETGFFKAWGSTFGGKPDAHGDVVVKGAFKDTIAAGGRNGNGIAMLYQHNAREPIGVWTKLEEREKGLYVEGELILDVQRAKETYVLMRKGALKGLSIGYDFPRLANGMRDPDSWETIEKGDSYVRYLKKLDLWEISPVTFPANIRANVITVKDFEDCKTEREWERVLRESGLSRSATQFIVKHIKPSLRESGNSEINLLLAALQERNALPRDF